MRGHTMPVHKKLAMVFAQGDVTLGETDENSCFFSAPAIIH
jgi:hypothetical protein